MFFFGSDRSSITEAIFTCLSVSYLPQLAQDDAEVLLLHQRVGYGGQVVFDNLGTEANVKLVYVVIIEGERGVADGHLGDISNYAKLC